MIGSRTAHKKKKIAISISIAVCLTILLTLSGIGMFFMFKKKNTQTPPEVIINPIDFSVDKWDGSTVDRTAYFSNLANRENSVTIDSAASFMYFVNQVNQGNTFEGITVYLNCSIDLNGYAIKSLQNFEGTFDGGFYNILNAKINGNGLFEETNNATIKNLGLYNCTINGTNKAAGLISTAVNTNIDNVFVRAGEIKANSTAGLVYEFISNNGNHKISNSFVDANSIDYAFVAELDTNNDIKNALTISGCYYTNAINAAADENNLVIMDVLNPTSVADFADWDYAKQYTDGAAWCDYSFMENSHELEFNFPVQSMFVKVYNTGSGYESTIKIGNTVENVTNLSKAVSLAGAYEEAEINLIVEKVFVENTANVNANSNVVIDTVVDTTIVRSNNNAEVLLAAVESGAKLTLGNSETGSAKITIDGNKEYIKTNNLNSDALIVTSANNLEIGTNVVLQNNINNTSSGGAVQIVNGHTAENEYLTFNIQSCETTGYGGAVCLIDSSVNFKGGNISGCHSKLGGGAITITSSDYLQHQGLTKSKYNVSPLNNSFVYSDLTIDGEGEYEWPDIIDANTTDGDGGYICITDGLSNGIEVIIKNITIANQSATGKGGVVYIPNDKEHLLRLNDAIFMNNSAAYGGAIYAPVVIGDTEAEGNMRSCEFINNTATQSGGAVWVNNTFSCSYCVFDSNKAEKNGGAIYIDTNSFGTATIKNSSIVGNETGEWGALTAPYAHVEIQDSIIDDNTSERYVAGAYLYEANVSNCSITNNSSLGTSGGLQIDKGTISNSIIANNTSADGGAGIFAYAYNNTTTIIQNCEIYNNYSTSGNALCLRLSSNGTAKIEDCSFDKNVGYSGAGLDAYSEDNSGSVEVKNCIFNKNQATNSNVGIVEGGGAITFGKVTATVTNCTFMSNRATLYGGAINTQETDLTVTNCYFDSNSADRYGGAIHADFNSNLYIKIETDDASDNFNKSTIFANNHSPFGGAIFIGGNLTAENAIFENNVGSNYGGAIYALETSCDIQECTFTENSADFDGGAIYAQKCESEITNCIFSNNLAQTSHGGAVEVNDGSVDIENCSFVNNSASMGGAITIEDSYQASNINNCSFAGNYTFTDGSGWLNGGGGAIYVQGAQIVCENLTFTNNTSNAHGGAISIESGKVEIYNNTFIGNEAIQGGAIHSYDSTLKIYQTYGVSSTFVNNIASSYGGAIYAACSSSAEYKTEIKNTSFDTNSASTEGGAIYVTGANAVLDMSNNCVLLDNSASAGSAIRVNQINSFKIEDTIFSNHSASSAILDVTGASTIEIENSIFRENTSSGLQSIINLSSININLVENYFYNNSGDQCDMLLTQSSTSTTVQDCYFIENTASRGSGLSSYGPTKLINSVFENNISTGLSDGGAVWNEDGNLTIYGCTFIDNTAKNGGAIYVKGDLTISTTDGTNTYESTRFIGNSADTNGGAIYAEECDLNIVGAEFIDNNGGAIYHITSNTDNELNITNVKFNGNKSDEGGALKTYGTTAITNSEFVNNVATSSGGAIYVSQGTLDIEGAQFEGNSSEYEDYTYGGGAIYAGDQASEIDIDNCYFNNNESAGSGGALNIKSGKLQISYCEFKQNISSQYVGGAIYSVCRNNNITNTTFISNIANEGGAIYGSGEIANCVFDSNTATREELDQTVLNTNSAYGGGAIFADNGATITNAIFKNNTAPKTYGGAITGSGDLTIDGCSFIGNSALFGGAVHRIGDNLTFKGNNNFSYNNASCSAGALYICGDIHKDGAAVTVNFTENSAPKGGAIAIGKEIECEIYPTLNINNNTAEYGGAIYIEHSTGVSIENESTMANNAATQAGGAIYFENSETDLYNYLHIWDVNHFLYNTSQYGGAIYIAEDKCSTYLNKCEFIGNIATSGDGGAIYSNNTSASHENFFNMIIFEDNKAPSGKGGAAYFESLVYGSSADSFSIENLNKNTAISGGGFYIGTVITSSGDTETSRMLQISEASSNIATHGAGGALYIAEVNINLHLTITHAEHNSAIGNGGVVAFYSGQNLLFDCSILQYNSTMSNGGALYVEEVNQLTIIGGDFYYNSASSCGGAVYSTDSISLYEYGDAGFSHNKAGKGGAIYCKKDFVDLASHNFYDNQAIAGDGGAIYTEQGVILSGSNFTNNSATGDGGAIYTVTGVTLDENCEFIRNTATNGGAIYQSEDVTSIIDEALFKNNVATNDGGAIYIRAALTICDTSFIDNNAANNGGAIWYNGADGALIYSQSDDSYQIIGNNAGNYGGAFYIQSGNASFTDTIITENSATLGGAIYTNVSVSIVGGSITWNSAIEKGGAIYNRGDVIGSLLFSGVTISDFGIIKNNHAPQGKDIFFAKNDSVLDNTCEYIDMIGFETLSNDPLNKISVYFDDDCVVTGNYVAKTENTNTAAVALSMIVVENNKRVDIDGANLIFADDGYAITIDSNGGDIGYSYLDGESEQQNIWIRNSTGTIYVKAGTNLLYADIKLTYPINLTIFKRDGYSSTGLYTSETNGARLLCNGYNVLAVDWEVGDPTILYAQWETANYSITYNLDGGKLAENNVSSYNIESDAFTLNNPTREGYAFAGWTGTDLASPTETVTVTTGEYGNRTYTATWQAIEYTITYHLPAGITLENPTTYTIESDRFTLHNPSYYELERFGYTFLGWVGTGLNAITTSVDIATGSTGNREYTAVYQQEYINHIFNIKVSNAADGSVDVTTLTIEKINGTYSIVENGNIIIIDGNEITATAHAGHMFIGWEIKPNHTTETTEIIARFTTTIVVTIEKTGALASNDFGVKVIDEDGNEIARYSNTFELAYESKYKLEAYANLLTDVSANAYQILTILVDDVEKNTWESGTAPTVTATVIDGTTTGIVASIKVNFNYLDAYLMKVSYTTSNIIKGIKNVEGATGDVVLDRTSSLNGFVISKNTTLSFEVDANANDGVTSKFYFTKFVYTTNAGVVSQGFAEIGKGITYYSNASDVYSYSTSLEISNLEIVILVETIGVDTAQLDWNKIGLSTLTIKSAEGHVKALDQATGEVYLYASVWEIQLPEGHSETVQSLQDFFTIEGSAVGMVYKDINGFYLELSL